MVSITLLFLVVYGLAVNEKPPLPPAERQMLRRDLAEEEEVEVRDKLDRTWERVRILQESYEFDSELVGALEAYIKENALRLKTVHNQLIREPSSIKRSYDRKKSAEWNRENSARPIRTFDPPSPSRFEKPYQLVIYEKITFEHSNSIVSLRDEKVAYLIISIRGNSILVELPANTSWDDRATEVSFVGEVQPFVGNIPGYSFDVILKPLLIRASYKRIFGYTGWVDPKGGRVHGARSPVVGDEVVYELNEIRQILR